jgi:hypothetical protein
VRSSDDPLTQALHFANWWTQLACAQRWQRAAVLLESVDSGAARLAFRHAASCYAVYHEEHRAHLPASRFDHDFGPELGDMEARWRALPDCPPTDAIPSWIQLTLARRFSDALEELQAPPTLAFERALLGVLALACRAAKREVELVRLLSWNAELE